jgi:hypothetical protein
MGDHASANGFEGQLATWIHWWSSVALASRCWPALALRLQQLVREQPGQDQPFWRCVVVDVGRVRQVLLRIAADIEKQGATSAAGRSSASGGERMLFRAWDGETRPSSVGELRPHFPDSPGGPDGSGLPGPLTAGRHVTTGKCRTVHKPPVHKPPRIRKREASRKVGCTRADRA